MKTFSVVVLAMAIVGSTARCANLCSGHGSCGADDACQCYPNWQAADCSARTCPFDFSFGGEGGDHPYAECSDRGVCNRKDGVCECNDGYSGSACQRVDCPDSCSNHGSCKTLKNLDAAYTGWDAEKIRVCKCDAGYTGPSCASRTCEPGLDPLTAADAGHEIHTFTATAAIVPDNKAIYFKFTDWRVEAWTTTSILGANLKTASIKQALEALPNFAVPSVKVTGTRATTFSVAFDDAGSNTGTAPTLEVITKPCVKEGCQPYSVGNHDGTSEVTVGVTVTHGPSGKVATDSHTCSNRGVCDGETGTCECFEGFYGQTCESQTIIT